MNSGQRPFHSQEEPHAEPDPKPRATSYTRPVTSWEDDLNASRDVGDRDRQGYFFLLSWFESWRLRLRLAPGREAARKFWKVEVVSKPRKDWQKKQWAEAMRWYLHWLEICEKGGKPTISLAERVRDAVELVDERRRAGEKVAQFFILGSASPELLQQSSETLAGRITRLSDLSVP